MSPAGVATVAKHEFVLRIRAGRWRWLLGIWFLVLLAFTLLLRSALDNISGEPVEDGGTVVFGGLMLLVLGLALLVSPALSAQSVNGDRERGVLATLQVTRLTPLDIALGKLVAAWGTALVFLALTLPLVGYAVALGGVTVTRVLAVLLVVALLLGTVVAVSLALSSLLSRTSTSGVLAYLAVFVLTIGTVVGFGLVTAVTAEEYRERIPTCEGGGPTPDGGWVEPTCRDTGETMVASRTRPDRTWWLLSPNPFVILADATPGLPPRTPEEEEEIRRTGRADARDLDPLGGIRDEVRDLRRERYPVTGAVEPGMAHQRGELEGSGGERVWPWGLGFDVALGVGAVWLTARRLRTPSRTLPRGQRVA